MESPIRAAPSVAARLLGCWAAGLLGGEAAERRGGEAAERRGSEAARGGGGGGGEAARRRGHLSSRADWCRLGGTRARAPLEGAHGIVCTPGTVSRMRVRLRGVGGRGRWRRGGWG